MFKNFIYLTSSLFLYSSYAISSGHVNDDIFLSPYPAAYLLKETSNKGTLPPEAEADLINNTKEKLVIQDDSFKEPIKLSTEEEFIQTFIKTKYDRELVTRFICACPHQKKLSEVSGISSATISKLKTPKTYGMLEPSAKRFWEWLQSHDIATLKNELELKDKNIKSIATSLRSLNLSSSNIVYNDLGEEIRSESRLDNTRPRLISDVIIFLQNMRGTFTHLNLANNLLSDEGVNVLVKELENHPLLEEINLSRNMISDAGLKALIPLVHGLKHLIKLNITKNYGPGEETFLKIKQAVPLDRQSKFQIIK